MSDETVSSTAGQPSARDPWLALGTANWGGSYGAPGREASVDEPTARSLAAAFRAAGHDLVDTAPAYGDAEDLVGRVFGGEARVVTKVPASVVLDGGAPVEQALASLTSSVSRTGVEQLAGVLLHDPDAAARPGSTARDIVTAVRSSGVAARVGVSVYAPADAFAAVERLGADLVQVPCNVVDQRFLTTGCIAELVAAGVEVHVRSVFLNGLLLADPASLSGPVAPLAPAVTRLRSLAERHGLSPLELALRFTRRALDVQAVLVGAFAAAQLAEILGAWESAAQEAGDDLDWSALDASDLAAVDPRSWTR